MPVQPDTLSSLASTYVKGMTSIRGRRVQRLLKREFAGAEYVFVLDASLGTAAVLGVSQNGAAFCATDGRGKQVSVVRWVHGSTEAHHTQYDLLKDSLPALSSGSLPLAGLCKQADLRGSARAVAPEARALVSASIQAMA